MAEIFCIETSSGYAFRVTPEGEVEVRTPPGACGLQRPTTQRYDSYALAAGALRALIELVQQVRRERDDAQADLAQLRARVARR